MKRVLIAATTTGYQIRSFGEAARALGIRLVFVSDRCDQLDDPWWDQAIPVRFNDPAHGADVVDAALGDDQIDGIVAVGDRPVVLAAHLAERRGLRGNLPGAAAASRNKLIARDVLRRAGMPVPRFLEVGAQSDVLSVAGAVDYPAVVKPLALSGSRGVIRVDSAEELAAAVVRVRDLLRSPDVRAERDAAHSQLLVESFIPGREFAVEALLTDGRLQLLAIFDKPDPLDGPFFEETIYVTPSREPVEVQSEIADAIARAADALGLRQGPVHAECRRNDDGIFVLEVAARPIGGLCSRVLRFEGPGGEQPQPLEALLLRHACGEDVAAWHREGRAAAVMMIPIPSRGVLKGVEGVEEARQTPDVEDVVITAKPDSVLVPLPEGRSYLGFIFARADRADAAERAVREAHRRLRFLIERELAITES